MRSRRISGVLLLVGGALTIAPGPASAAVPGGAPGGASDPAMQCTFSGTLTFTPAVRERPRATSAELKGHAVLCSAPDIAGADINGTLDGQVGTETSQISGTLASTWHLKSGETAVSSHEVTAVAVGAAFTFEGTTTSGRFAGHQVRITPLVRPEFDKGGTSVELLAHLKLKHRPAG